MNAATSFVDEVIFSDELISRSSRFPNYDAENTALAFLTREMVENPTEVLQKLANLVLKLCDAGSDSTRIARSP